MDFLDPKKERRNRLTLLLGYCLVAVAIAIATLVLLYQSYGYNLTREGTVTQNGLVFVSSQPSNASIYLSGQRYKSNTNTRVLAPTGSYELSLGLSGYRGWQCPLEVNGGDVQHFDYPFLFPEQLKTSSLEDTATLPNFASQSLDRRRVLTAQAESPGNFTRYDLKNPAQPVATTITLPEGSYTPGTGAQTWTNVEWSTDNVHCLALHTYQTGETTGKEYVLLNRDVPAESVNLTTTLKLTQTESVTLFNNRVQQVFVYEAADSSLTRVNVADASEVSKLQHVIAYKSYADNKILYVSDQSSTGKTLTGQVYVLLQDGQRTTTLRTLPAGPGTSFALNLAQYDNNWYMAVSSTNEASVYIYKNPQSAKVATPESFPAAWRRLLLKAPNYLAFSSNTQYLLAESGQDMVVYDFENITQYRYRTSETLDAPQTHATWMDGARLQYVSGGKLLVFDYDQRNKQALMPMSATSQPFYSPNYRYVFGLRDAAQTAKPGVSSTPLTVAP